MVNNIEFLQQTVTFDVMVGFEGSMDGKMIGEVPVNSAKGTVMSSWPFVIGVTSATLVLSIAIGILLAKKRIKKGLDLYED